MGVFSRTMLMLTMAWLVGLIVTFLYASNDPEAGWRDKFIAEANVRRALAYQVVNIKGGVVAERGHDKGDNKRSMDVTLDPENPGNAPLGEGTGGGSELLPGAKVRKDQSLIELETQQGNEQQNNLLSAKADAEKRIVELRNSIANANRDRRKEESRLAQVADRARQFASEMESYRYLIASFQQKVFNLDYEIQRVMIEYDALTAELAQVQNDTRRLDSQQLGLEDQYWEVTRRYEATVRLLGKYTNADPNLQRMADMAGRSLRGRVVSVGSDPRTGVVSISLGSNEGVQENQEFTIHRDGKFVGKMRVESISNNVSVGRLLPAFRGKQVVMENDSVKTAEAFGGAALGTR